MKTFQHHSFHCMFDIITQTLRTYCCFYLFICLSILQKYRHFPHSEKSHFSFLFLFGNMEIANLNLTLLLIPLKKVLGDYDSTSYATICNAGILPQWASSSTGSFSFDPAPCYCACRAAENASVSENPDPNVREQDGGLCSQLGTG